jgi:predicted secreted hydrolase
MLVLCTWRNLIPDGSVSGLVARGGFLVGLKWKDHKFVSATVDSQRGGVLSLRVEDGRDFMINGSAYSTGIDTVAGTVYEISV